ncbi:condensin-2 complex subunit H2 isoform X2 [Octodon degus]|uniref:Condensin-2 complex subunit H2 n=1 Tax=Octodon degus TaxID=10160 RepID=A0A6P6DEB3_OCTDE|nr:condensin-2 complex subunit H2 isoform X2 [Octodon degus]
MEDVEARFAHLLQPIRDLTKNWEVDVAAQLGEYLEELDQICISFDEGKTTMNFIEAALLIQGSACVYSKKVEYLYSLVCQALDFISGKRRAKQLSSVQEDGAGGASNSQEVREAEDEFLSLDDFPESRTNVDLKSDQAPSELLIIPLLPMALVGPDEVEKNSCPLYSRQGEVLASRKDFRMNTCTPNPRGAFMLEPVGLCPMPGSQEGEVLDARRAEEQPMEVSGRSSPVPVLGFCQDKPGTAPGSPVLSGGSEDDVAVQEAAELSEAASPRAALEPEELGSPQQSVTPPKRCMLREREVAPEAVSRLQEASDPWQSLDPFDSLDSKPFKKGKPYSVPTCVEEMPGQKRKRKGAAKLQDFHQWYLAAYADHADSRRTRRKGPTFADMEALYWKHVTEQLEALRRLQRRETAERWLPRAEEGLWPAEDDHVEDSLEDLGAADDFLEPEEDVEIEGAEPGEGPNLDAEALRYEELVRRNVELFIATSQKFVQETELSQRIRDWEDTIQPLLQEQEQHKPFDIHTYGDQVVSQFPQLNEWCPFAELVAGQPAFEVCRSMLASLQLANDYTVEIRQQPGLEAAVDTMSLRLLTHQRAHRRFQTYAAPSMAKP